MNKCSVFVTVVALLSVGCGAMNAAQEQDQPGEARAAAQVQPGERPMGLDVNHAVAVLHPTKGNDVSGVVHFYQQEGGQVRVVAEVRGLKPNSEHGFHIHQYGDCTAPDATSAGGHYSPEGHPHNLPPKSPRHAGDLGNIEANAEGVARKEIVVDNISISGAQAPVLGRAVIVHAQRDTGQGESGEAGARIACGVIGIANPKQQ